MRGNVLLIGELISNGGLGLMGDLITVTSLGSNPVLAVGMVSTLRTPLNRAFRVMDTDYLIQQMRDGKKKPGYQSIKIGALGSEEMVEAIADEIKCDKINEPIVYCPIVCSDMGAPLLDAMGIQKVQTCLIPLVDVLILNVYDAEILTGITIPGREEMEVAAKRLRDFGAKAVLITGGLLGGSELYDVFLDDRGLKVMTFQKHEAHLENPYRFGGAWILATAVAAGLAQNLPMMEAINQARQYVDKAIAKATNSDGKYQHLFLTHTISHFEYQPDCAAYNLITSNAVAGM
ncbi:MAG: bifunctional hydroxymethylpyrimidine kinase/phosphomethylpyrimidine kinase [Alphaproteobacteria bacterium]|nr:bifunctional hydroxymethylpyrimidine kinase/phosphomethylpyrimidine kinase [Alphaproteobacteria bacterium]